MSDQRLIQETSLCDHLFEENHLTILAICIYETPKPKLERHNMLSHSIASVSTPRTGGRPILEECLSLIRSESVDLGTPNSS